MRVLAIGMRRHTRSLISWALLSTAVSCGTPKHSAPRLPPPEPEPLTRSDQREGDDAQGPSENVAPPPEYGHKVVAKPGKSDPGNKAPGTSRQGVATSPETRDKALVKPE